MPKNPDSLPGFTETLVAWFAQHGRCYPWRETQDPWAILVSEVMLQQTTIPTVLGRYNEWMRRFPNPEALAVAGEQEALRSWEGLGYYRRVRALQATARAVTEQYSGIFPRDEAALRALPGVGEYTLMWLVCWPGCTMILLPSIPLQEKNSCAAEQKFFFLAAIHVLTILPSWSWGKHIAPPIPRSANLVPCAPSAAQKIPLLSR